MATMKLSVVIPCYNERPTIETVVEAVRSAPVKEVEIIIVDDGSTDGTRELLQTKPQGWVDKIVLQERNFGKGAALRVGFQQLRATWLSCRMRIWSMTRRNIPLLIHPISGRSCRRRLRFAVHGRPGSSGGLFLAYGGKPVSHIALEYVYQLESHRYGDVL